MGTKHETATWIGAQTFQPRFQCPRRQPVVGVQEHQQFALGRIDAGVARGRETSMRLTETAHTGIAARHFGDGFARAVVDNDDLMVLVAL